MNQEGTARIMVDEALNRGSREIQGNHSHAACRRSQVPPVPRLPGRRLCAGPRSGAVGALPGARNSGCARGRRVDCTRSSTTGCRNFSSSWRSARPGSSTAPQVRAAMARSQHRPHGPALSLPRPRALSSTSRSTSTTRAPRGAVTAGWGEVTQSTKGEAIEIGGYELWWRENETLAVWRRASSSRSTVSQ